MPDISLLIELINGRKMTKEELIAQRETINNLIKLKSEKQIECNKKESSLLMIGLLLITFALADNITMHIKNI